MNEDSMDTRDESLRLLKEAEEDLGRAVRYSGLKDWITTIHYAQMATKKSAKALISCFESFEWTHDPSGQVRKLVRKKLLNNDFLKIASHVKEAAPWHGRSTYGGVKKASGEVHPNSAQRKKPRTYCIKRRNL